MSAILYYTSITMLSASCQMFRAAVPLIPNVQNLASYANVTLIAICLLCMTIVMGNIM